MISDETTNGLNLNLENKGVNSSSLREAGLDVLQVLNSISNKYVVGMPAIIHPAEVQSEEAKFVPELIPSSLSTSSRSNSSEPLHSTSSELFDVSLGELQEEMMVIHRYVDLATVFINNSSRRRSSSDTQPEHGHRHTFIMHSDEEDEELPAWAIDVEMSAMNRAYMTITDHIPLTLSSRLLQPTSLSSSQFLLSLSGGEVLCTAFNGLLRRSPNRSFGFIPSDVIHNCQFMSTAAENIEGKSEKIGNTFRRIDNLRRWIGALKFRYHIALPPWPFDAKSVGTEADGWEVMLEGALMQWVERVVEERRSD